jgi:hypothetical protein
MPYANTEEGRQRKRDCEKRRRAENDTDFHIQKQRLMSKLREAFKLNEEQRSQGITVRGLEPKPKNATLEKYGIEVFLQDTKEFIQVRRPQFSENFTRVVPQLTRQSKEVPESLVQLIQVKQSFDKAKITDASDATKFQRWRDFKNIVQESQCENIVTWFNNGKWIEYINNKTQVRNTKMGYFKAFYFIIKHDLLPGITYEGKKQMTEESRKYTVQCYHNDPPPEVEVPKLEVFVNEHEKQSTDKSVDEFFELSEDHEGSVKIATWNCSSGFTTQFEHFRDFMKTRAEPYIDILCLQGMPMTQSGKHDDAHTLFEECGFTYVYDEMGPDIVCHTMTLFKRSFLDSFAVLPREGNTRKDLEFYHVKQKGTELDSLDGNFMLCNAYFRHGIPRDSMYCEIDNYNDLIGSPYQVIVGDLNYDAHDDIETQGVLAVRSMTPDGISTCNGYRADHILSDIHVMSMVDERFTRGKYKGYTQISGNHFHQPVYGFFVPHGDYSIYQCQQFYDTQKQLGCFPHLNKIQTPTM